VEQPVGGVKGADRHGPAGVIWMGGGPRFVIVFPPSEEEGLGL